MFHVFLASKVRAYWSHDYIGVDIFGILSKAGGGQKGFISLSHYSYDLIINIHYTLENLDLILALVINIIHKINSLIYKNCRVNQ